MSLTGGVGARSPRKRSRGEGAEAAVAADGRRGADGDGRAEAGQASGRGLCRRCKRGAPTGAPKTSCLPARCARSPCSQPLYPLFCIMFPLCNTVPVFSYMCCTSTPVHCASRKALALSPSTTGLVSTRYLLSHLVGKTRCVFHVAGRCRNNAEAPLAAAVAAVGLLAGAGGWGPAGTPEQAHRPPPRWRAAELSNETAAYCRARVQPGLVDLPGLVKGPEGNSAGYCCLVTC